MLALELNGDGSQPGARADAGGLEVHDPYRVVLLVVEEKVRLTDATDGPSPVVGLDRRDEPELGTHPMPTGIEENILERLAVQAGEVTGCFVPSQRGTHVTFLAFKDATQGLAHHPYVFAHFSKF